MKTILRICTNINYSKEDILYKPKTTFKDGLEKFIKWKIKNYSVN